MINIWNKTGSDSSSSVLMKATVSSVNIPQCDTFYQTLRRRIPQGLNNQQLCAVNETADTCQVSSNTVFALQIQPFKSNFNSKYGRLYLKFGNCIYFLIYNKMNDQHCGNETGRLGRTYPDQASRIWPILRGRDHFFRKKLRVKYSGGVY